LVGAVKAILSDHGSQFTSKKWQETLKTRGIIPIHSSVYHPQSNPTERVNKEIGKICRIECHDKHTRWPQVVQLIEDCLNYSVHGTTGEIPHEVMFGEKVTSLLEKIVEFPRRREYNHGKKLELVAERLESKAERRKRKHEEKNKIISYQEGELVLVRTHHLSDKLTKKIKKFFLLYEGPFEVKEVKLENAYVVVDPETKEKVGTYNVTELKKFLQ